MWPPDPVILYQGITIIKTIALYIDTTMHVNHVFCIIYSVHLASLLEYHRASIQLQMDQLLFHVKERFSEILLPAESITKLELSGKGNSQIVKIVICIYTWLFTYICSQKSGAVNCVNFA